MTMLPIAIFCLALRRLSAMLDKVASQPQILQARLYPDMLPFAAQVNAAISFALRGCCPLAGREVVSFNDGGSLQQQVARTIAYLAAIPEPAFEGAAERLCHDRAGFADIALPGDAFLHLYILPNFYFHFSMAYAIARSCGAPIGKGDFDGYHAYAPGFSFESPAA